MATLTVYPSLDGHVADGNNDLTWANLIGEPGMYSVDDGDSGALINITASTTTGQWKTLYRSIFLFDTSALASGEVISATLSLYGKAAKADALSITPDVNVYASNPASSTTLTGTDFATLGSAPFCDTAIAYGDWNEGTPGTANEFILNTAGLAAISTSGITKLGIRNANYDVSGNAPGNWVSAAGSTISCWFVEKGTTYRPMLVIIYTPSGVATVTTQAVTDISGTIATGNGTITDLGVPNPTAHGVCYNTTGTPTTTDTATDEGAATATGAFTSAMTSLTEGTLYYLRAYATNAAGTGYGGQVTFTAGAPGSGEGSGGYAVVETRFHYVDAYGVERALLGEAV